MKYKKTKIWLFRGLNFIVPLVLVFLLYSCSAMEIEQVEVNQEDIKVLENLVKSDSLDLDAVKRLSILLVQDHQNKKANSYLAKAL